MSGVVGHRGLLLGSGPFAPEGGTAFDSSLNTSLYSYANSDRETTKINTDAHALARSVASHAAGKHCFMVALTSEISADGLVAGIATSATPTGSGNYPGVDATSWGCQFNRPAGPVAHHGGSFINFWSTTQCVPGDVAMIAVDIDAGKIWFGRNGTWYIQPVVGASNPATGVDPAFTFTPNITLFAALSDFYHPAVRRGYFDPAYMPYAAPAGYSGW